ncbi:MAG: hypothetical protein R3335_09645 [Anaerolineales bacterium]|nr:hypothetical protein [Anaerolineales bacterium]
MDSKIAKTITITRAQEIYLAWTTDVLLYIVVLNLFVEYLEAIVIDSFFISILTAVLLKAMIRVIGGFEHRVSNFFKQREGAINRILGILSVFAILFLSKFVILEVVDIVFGDHVDLGGLVEIIALVLTLIIVTQGSYWIFRRLGSQDEEAAESLRP